MKKPTTISKESVSEYREFIQLRLRKRVLEAIEVVLEEEVNQALELCRFSRFLVSHAGSWHPELASSHRRRHATGFGSVAISTAVFRTLVATTPPDMIL